MARHLGRLIVDVGGADPAAAHNPNLRVRSHIQTFDKKGHGASLGAVRGRSKLSLR